MGRKNANKFSKLNMFCDVVVAHESKFQKCPLVREFDTFADCNVESEFQTPPYNQFPDDHKNNVEGASSEFSTVDLCCTDVVGIVYSGEGKFGNGFNEKKIRVLEEPWNELSKTIKVSENLDLRRPTEESLVKKSRASDHLDLECKSVNKYSVNPKPILMKMKEGEDSNGSEVINLVSEEFDEKTGRENLGVDSHMKICAESGGVADKGEAIKIGECRGGSKDSKLQMYGLREEVVEISENKKLGKISEFEMFKITEGEKAYKNIDEGDPDSAKNVAKVEMVKYAPSAADIGKKKKARVGGSGVSDGERRDLPSSLKEIEKNAKEREVAGNMETKNGFLIDFSKVLIGDVDSAGKDVDFLETAKRRGLTFPRPRWWPPEGFDK